MTLVGVLVAVAVMGILAATLASVYEGMTRVMRRTSMQNEVDNVQRFIQGVLSQKTLCDNAFRTTFQGAGVINWDYKTQPFGNIPVIQLWDPTSNKAISVLASTLTSINPTTGAPFNQVMPGLTVTSIQIQTPGRAPYSEQKVIKSGVTRYAVPAEVLITFQGQTNWSGGVFRPRPIPLVAVFDSARNLLECDVVIQANQTRLCKTLQDAFDDKGYSVATGCPLGSGSLAPCPQGPEKGISQIVFFDGYDANNKPICNCQKICGGGPSTPGSAYDVGVAAGGGSPAAGSGAGSGAGAGSGGGSGSGSGSGSGFGGPGGLGGPVGGFSGGGCGN